MKTLDDAVRNVDKLSKLTLKQMIALCDEQVKINTNSMEKKSSMEKLVLAERNDRIKRYRMMFVSRFNR